MKYSVVYFPFQEKLVNATLTASPRTDLVLPMLTDAVKNSTTSDQYAEKQFLKVAKSLRLMKGE